MKKAFTFTLPDGPYLNTTNDNNTVSCLYDGPRWLCLCIENGTHNVRNVETTGETEEELNFDVQIEEGHYFVKMKAEDNLVVAAYLTHNYSHEEIEDINETLTDAEGETFQFEYHYDTAGVIGQVCYFGSVKYIPTDGTYSGPQYRQHANTREETLANFVILAQSIQSSLDNPENDYTDEDRRRLTEHMEWVKSIPTRYADIPHWKIPFHTDIPVLL